MRTLTVERALAEAHKAGCVFRLAGDRVEVSGVDKVPADAIAILREHRAAVFAHLGGNELDRPNLELLAQLDVEFVYCTTDAEAEAAVFEMLADAGDRSIAIDIETAPRSEYANPVPLRLTVRGRPMKVQPKSDDKVGLDPHRAEPRLVQLYGGGARVAVLDMKFVSWDILAPVWQRPLVAHNAAFELALLAKRGVYPQTQCTMQAAGLLLGVRRRSLADLPGRPHPRACRCASWCSLGGGSLMLRASTLNACRRALLHGRWAGTEAGGPEEDAHDLAVVHRNSLSSECFNFGKEPERFPRAFRNIGARHRPRARGRDAWGDEVEG
jgi:hypothetical protein